MTEMSEISHILLNGMSRRVACEGMMRVDRIDSQHLSCTYVCRDVLPVDLAQATERSLVIIDELGRGTEPRDGISIAGSVRCIESVFLTEYSGPSLSIDLLRVCL
jgi:hypothetical protein